MTDLPCRLRPVIDPAAPAAAWRTLERQADPPFFLSWAWIGGWLRQLPAGARPLSLEIGPAEAPVGLGILVPKRVWRHRVLPVRQWLLHETGEPALDRLAIEDNGLLLHPAADPALVRRALAWLPGALAGCDELVMRQVSPGFAALALAALSGVGAGVNRAGEDVRRWVDLERVRAAGDYAALLSAGSRQALRRARRAHGPLAVEPARSAGEALAFFEAMRPLHEARWQAKGKPGAFASPAFAPFHRRLIAEHWTDDMRGCGVQMLRVSAGGAAIGYLYNLMRRGWVHNYQGGFAYAAHAGDARAKPGLVCHAAAVEHAAQDGAAAYDLMAGDSRYKASLATDSERLTSLVAGADRPLLRLEAALRAWRRQEAVA